MTKSKRDIFIGMCSFLLLFIGIGYIIESRIPNSIIILPVFVFAWFFTFFGVIWWLDVKDNKKKGRNVITGNHEVQEEKDDNPEMAQRQHVYLFLWAICFIAFFVFYAIAGGDVITGKIEKGVFFLRSRTVYTEVSKATFIISGLLSAIFGIFPPLLLFSDRKSLISKYGAGGVFMILFSSLTILCFVLPSIFMILRALFE